MIDGASVHRRLGYFRRVEEELKPFSPKIDWGQAPFEALNWVGTRWVIAAVVTLLVLVLLVRFTRWGQQFWYITGAYFTGPHSLKVWAWLGVILLSVVVGVKIDVLLSYQGNDLMTSVQVAVQGLANGNEEVRQSGISGFWFSLLCFAVLATLHVARVMLDLFLVQRFMLAWRVWLTDRLTGDWLDGHAYYRNRFIDDTIDNPDQRIQSDIDIFTTNVGPLPNIPNNLSSSTLLFGAVESVLSVAAFTSILWGLSGDLTLPLIGVTVPRAMFWTAFGYVLIATVIAIWVGKPLVRLTFDNEKYNAAFRYALVRLRDASEAVAFYRGEAAERLQLRQRFEPVVSNYKRYINRSVKFYGWNLTMSQIINPLPWVIQGPRVFSGELQLGDVSQTSSAFGAIQSGLSFFRNAYDSFAGWQASIIRLYGLAIANEQGRALPALTVEPSGASLVELEDVEVRTPDGRQLIDDLDLRLNSGESLIISGKSGTGKTTLLRSMAQLWPFASGTLRCPAGDTETMFLSQLPYVPLGDLRAVVSYPHEPGDIPDAQLQQMLTKVALPNLADRLDDVEDWAKVLSPGEQQRIAFARILLTRPRVVFLDEASSALDEGLETMLYTMVRTDLPDTVLVSIAHRGTVAKHHQQRLELPGDGSWRLGRTGEPVPV